MSIQSLFRINSKNCKLANVYGTLTVHVVGQKCTNSLQSLTCLMNIYIANMAATLHLAINIVPL